VCTLALYLNVFDELPLLLAANRDEHFDRPSAPPAEIVGVPRIVAGRDLRAGGTWLGVNEHGLMVGILNRRQNGNDIYTPVTSMARSRGLLCMDILRLRSVDEGFAFITAHQAVYNPFTLVFADRHSAGVAHNNHAAIFAKRLGAGVHVFSSAAELDLNSAKADRAHARFAHSKSAFRPAPSIRRIGLPNYARSWRIIRCATDRVIPATPSACTAKAPVQYHRVWLRCGRSARCSKPISAQVRLVRMIFLKRFVYQFDDRVRQTETRRYRYPAAPRRNSRIRSLSHPSA
jgi:hypothetical protein